MTKVTKASYIVLTACTVTHFFNHIYTGALSPYMPIIRDELSLSFTEIGIVSSAVVAAMTSTHLLVGYLSDRGWRDIFIPISILLGALMILLTSLATAFLFLVTSQVLLGIASSVYHPSVFPALAERFPSEERAKATGILAIGGLAGIALIPFLGVTMLVILGGWRDSLVFLGLIGVIAFVPVALSMRYSNRKGFKVEEETNDEIDIEEGWTRNFALVVLLMGLRQMTFRSITLLWPIYLVDAYGYEPVWGGILTTIMLTAGLFAEVISAYASDKIGRRVPFLVMSAALTVPCLFLLNYSLDPLFLFLILIGIGFFFFFGVPPFTAFQTEVSPKKSRGLAFGVFFSVGSIPGAISPFIFGAIADNFGLSVSVTFLVIATIIATLVSLLLKEVNGTSKSSRFPVHPDSVPHAD